MPVAQFVSEKCHSRCRVTVSWSRSRGRQKRS